jgi:hypothetical protein
LPPSSTLIRPAVRSVANAADSLYCMQLGQNTVHGAMAGCGLLGRSATTAWYVQVVATWSSIHEPARSHLGYLGVDSSSNTVPPLKPGEKRRLACRCFVKVNLILVLPLMQCCCHRRRCRYQS